MTEEARKPLEKAERALNAAKTQLRAGDAEFAAGRSYYAMFHAAQALLRQEGLRYRPSSGWVSCLIAGPKAYSMNL